MKVERVERSSHKLSTSVRSGGGGVGGRGVMAYQSQTEGILWEEKERRRRRMGDRQTQQAITTVSTQEQDEAPLHQPRGCWRWQSHCSSLLWFLFLSLSFLYVVKKQKKKKCIKASPVHPHYFFLLVYGFLIVLPNFLPPFFFPLPHSCIATGIKASCFHKCHMVPKETAWHRVLTSPPYETHKRQPKKNNNRIKVETQQLPFWKLPWGLIFFFWSLVCKCYLGNGIDPYVFYLPSGRTHVTKWQTHTNATLNSADLPLAVWKFVQSKRLCTAAHSSSFFILKNQVTKRRSS